MQIDKRKERISLTVSSAMRYNNQTKYPEVVNTWRILPENGTNVANVMPR